MVKAYPNKLNYLPLEPKVRLIDEVSTDYSQVKERKSVGITEIPIFTLNII